MARIETRARTGPELCHLPKLRGRPRVRGRRVQDVEMTSAPAVVSPGRKFHATGRNCRFSVKPRPTPNSSTMWQTQRGF
jgi:hypothetical protein